MNVNFQRKPINIDVPTIKNPAKSYFKYKAWKEFKRYEKINEVD